MNYSFLLQNPESEAAKKREEAERLRAAEKFMKVGTGEAFCKGCGYVYKPSKGDPEYPISAGTYFQVRAPLCCNFAVICKPLMTDQHLQICLSA